MIIRVNLYKVSSGKRAYGEIVDIGNTKPWNRGEFVQAIIDNQTFVIPGT